MADNAQKTPFSRSLNLIAQKRALDQIQLLGKALPASVVSVNNSIVTVNFELQSDYTLPQVTCPMFGPEYIRYPTQVGDKGIVIPADVVLGGINGLGTGVAELTMPANLSALVFLPIASSKWSPTDDPNALVLYGPDGVIIRDANSKCIMTLTASGVVFSC